MAYSEELAARTRDLLAMRDGVGERRMFGAVVWMVNGNMACGALADGLMVRLEPDDVEPALAEPGVGPMTSGGRTMRGFVRVALETLEDDEELARWVDAGAGFAASLPPK